MTVIALDSLLNGIEEGKPISRAKYMNIDNSLGDLIHEDLQKSYYTSVQIIPQKTLIDLFNDLISL